MRSLDKVHSWDVYGGLALKLKNLMSLLRVILELQNSAVRDTGTRSRMWQKYLTKKILVMVFHALLIEAAVVRKVVELLLPTVQHVSGAEIEVSNRGILWVQKWISGLYSDRRT